VIMVMKNMLVVEKLERETGSDPRRPVRDPVIVHLVNEC